MPSTKHSDAEDLAEALWLDPLGASRNKNFSLYDSPSGRRALSIYRLLRSVRRDLIDNREVAVRHEQHGTVVVLDLPAVHGRRTVTLSPRMFGLLEHDPALGPIMATSTALR